MTAEDQAVIIPLLEERERLTQASNALLDRESAAIESLLDLHDETLMRELLALCRKHNPTGGYWDFEIRRRLRTFADKSAEGVS